MSTPVVSIAVTVSADSGSCTVVELAGSCSVVELGSLLGECGKLEVPLLVVSDDSGDDVECIQSNKANSFPVCSASARDRSVSAAVDSFLDKISM